MQWRLGLPLYIANVAIIGLIGFLDTSSQSQLVVAKGNMA
jgi:hypothetical protein